MNINEHKFLADFQPFGDITKGMLPMVLGSILNWLALFGVFYVIGLALRLGLNIGGVE